MTTTSMNERIAEILAHLAAAFGGKSQYDETDVGRAIAGQIRNNGLIGDAASLAAEAARQIDDMWDGGMTDAAVITAAIEESDHRR